MIINVQLLRWQKSSLPTTGACWSFIATFKPQYTVMYNPLSYGYVHRVMHHVSWTPAAFPNISHVLSVECSSQMHKHTNHFEEAWPLHTAIFLACTVCAVVTLLHRSSSSCLLLCITTQALQVISAAQIVHAHWTKDPPSHPLLCPQLGPPSLKQTNYHPPSGWPLWRLLSVGRCFSWSSHFDCKPAGVVEPACRLLLGATALMHSHQTLSVTGKGPPERRLVECALTALLRVISEKMYVPTECCGEVWKEDVWVDSSFESEKKIKVESGETSLFEWFNLVSA